MATAHSRPLSQARAVRLKSMLARHAVRSMMKLARLASVMVETTWKILLVVLALRPSSEKSSSFASLETCTLDSLRGRADLHDPPTPLVRLPLQRP